MLAVFWLAAGAAPACAQTGGMIPSPAPASQAQTPARTGANPNPFAMGTATPSPLPSELKHAQSLDRQGQHEQALAEVDSFVKSHPDDPSGRFLRGVILADLGRTKEAIDTFTLLTVDHPEFDQPYNNLGVLYAQQGDLERARQWLEQAVQANPQSNVALENLGDVYARLAMLTYEKASALDSKSRNIRSKLTLSRNLAKLAASPAEAGQAPAGPQGTKGPDAAGVNASGPGGGRSNSTPPPAQSR